MTGLANNMASAWAKNPQNWQAISMEEAQSYANKGYFVVAGYCNSGGNGHVVVIVPGKMTYSSKWKCNVPRCMDAGPGRREVNTTLSWGFNPELKDKIHYYYYKK